MTDTAIEREADLVGVGLGAAAIAAGVDAHDAGLEVVVLEKAPEGRAGGNSRVSGQVWFCPDDVEEAKVYLRALSGEYPLPEPLIDAWAKGCGENTSWIAARAEEVRDQVPRDDGD